MKSANILSIVLTSFFIFSGCAEKGNSNPASSGATKNSNGITLPVQSGINVMPITVNGSLCSSGSYVNKPCVSVTVCIPGTTTCQEITDILLDTGSTGLRVFSQALTVSLPSLYVGGKSIAECVQFGDGSSDWGKLSMADVVLNTEPAVTIPIQVIDSTLWNSSSFCAGADTGPSMAGFNGILGVGLFAQDCGLGCDQANDPTGQNGLYFSCGNTTCSGTSISVSNQIQNPVSLLPVDNNGVILQFPQVPLGGATFVNGYLLLGIGTRTNNSPSGVTTYAADPSIGEFLTTFNGSNYPSFIDSGSNAIYFPSPSSQFPDCGGNAAGFFCPSSTLNLTAENMGYTSSPSGSVSFQTGNARTLAATGSNVFVELGGNNSSMVDWGIPFYFGRNIYVGIENTTSPLGSGPYWAY